MFWDRFFSPCWYWKTDSRRWSRVNRTDHTFSRTCPSNNVCRIVKLPQIHFKKDPAPLFFLVFVLKRKEAAVGFMIHSTQ